MQIRKGFTMVETLVVIAIIAILILVSLPALLNILQTYFVKTAASQLAIHLRFARNECVTTKIKYRVVINNKDSITGPNTYKIQYDPQKDSTFETVSTVDVKLPSGIEILDSTVFSSGVATISFKTTGGASSTTGTPPYTIDIQALNGVIYRLKVQLTGAVDVQKV